MVSNMNFINKKIILYVFLFSFSSSALAVFFVPILIGTIQQAGSRFVMSGLASSSTGTLGLASISMSRAGMVAGIAAGFGIDSYLNGQAETAGATPDGAGGYEVDELSESWNFGTGATWGKWQWNLVIGGPYASFGEGLSACQGAVMAENSSYSTVECRETSASCIGIYEILVSNGAETGVSSHCAVPTQTPTGEKLNYGAADLLDDIQANDPDWAANLQSSLLSTGGTVDFSGGANSSSGTASVLPTEITDHPETEYQLFSFTAAEQNSINDMLNGVISTTGSQYLDNVVASYVGTGTLPSFYYSPDIVAPVENTVDPINFVLPCGVAGSPACDVSITDPISLDGDGTVFDDGYLSPSGSLIPWSDHIDRITNVAGDPSNIVNSPAGNPLGFSIPTFNGSSSCPDMSFTFQGKHIQIGGSSGDYFCSSLQYAQDFLAILFWGLTAISVFEIWRRRSV